jgi:hypothetical protein
MSLFAHAATLPRCHAPTLSRSHTASLAVCHAGVLARFHDADGAAVSCCQPWVLAPEHLEDASTHLTYEACMTGTRGDADDWSAEDAAEVRPRRPPDDAPSLLICLAFGVLLGVLPWRCFFLCWEARRILSPATPLCGGQRACCCSFFRLPIPPPAPTSPSQRPRLPGVFTCAPVCERMGCRCWCGWGRMGRAVLSELHVRGTCPPPSPFCGGSLCRDWPQRWRRRAAPLTGPWCSLGCTLPCGTHSWLPQRSTTWAGKCPRV